MSEPFLGQVLMFAGNFAPRGWAFCDGQLLPINQYQALFSIMGTTYGGDGETTFGLPDLRGRTAVHPGSGPGLPLVVGGQRGGATSFTLTESQLPSHDHTLRASDSDGTASAPEANALGAFGYDAPPLGVYSGDAPSVDMAAGSVGNAGGSQAVQKRSPFTGVNYIIALQGFFPSES